MLGIRHRFTFDGVEMPSRVKTVKIKEKELSGHLKKTIQKTRFLIKQEWRLDCLPEIDIKFVSEDGKIPIKAEIHFSADTNPPPPKTSLLGMILTFIVASSILGLIAMATFVNYAEKKQQEPQCFIYYKNNIPTKIVIDTSEYNIKEDGSLPKETRVFLNPWQLEYIDSGRCQSRSY